MGRLKWKSVQEFIVEWLLWNAEVSGQRQSAQTWMIDHYDEK